MKNKVCLATIKTEYDNLTKKERQIADYILANHEKITTLPIAELAANAGVAKSAVIRFCRSIGFDGYSDFKMALSGELARNEKFNFTPYINSSDNPVEIMQKIFAANIKTLHDTIVGIDKQIYTDAIKAIGNAENIYIYGIGTSAGIVCDFHYRLMQLGFKAFCFTDTANMKVSTMNISSKDVAIGISHSGRTVATVDSLKLAKKKGAATICLTAYPNNCITNNCDYPLVIKTDEIQYPIEAISARIAHISVLDSIAISLSSRDIVKANERFSKTRELLDTVRY